MVKSSQSVLCFNCTAAAISIFCVRVYVCVCLSVDMISPEPCIDMDKYHGSLVQQDSGDVLSKRKHFLGSGSVH